MGLDEKPLAGAPVHYYEAEPGSTWSHVDELLTVLPGGQPRVTLANWQEDPYHAWSFQHMRELMPSQVIDGCDEARPLPVELTPVGDLPVPGMPGTVLPGTVTVEDVLATTYTDGFPVLRDGTIREERYTTIMVPRRRHLVMSVTKSIVSAVAGSLAGAGVLDPEAPLETYFPELAGTGYAGARVRTVLDMRSGVLFQETYLDPRSEVRVMERSMGWAPRNHGDPLGMYPYILTVRRERPHDGRFTYRSVDTDVLGWVCERASGRRMAHLISDLVWQPIGAFHDAEITCDPLGSAIHDGGLSATLRDLGRFGLMLQDRGRVGDRQVVPSWWLDQAFAPPADVRSAFAVSDNEAALPGGWYRNQFWFLPGPHGVELLCLGIHGQLVYVDPATRTVCVKLSAWPQPQNLDYLLATIQACRAVSTASLSR